MKKLFIILTLISYITYGQNDSIQLTTLSDMTSPPDDARFYFWYVSGADTFDRNITREYLMPWTFQPSTSKLYPRSLTYDIGIGKQSETGWKLDIAGNVRISSTLRMANNGVIWWDNGSYVRETGTELYFYSPTVGSNTSLTSLISGGTSPGGINAITKTSSGGVYYYKLGGYLSENTTINVNGVGFFVTNPTYGGEQGLYVYGSGSTYLQAGNNQTLYLNGGDKTYIKVEDYSDCYMTLDSIIKISGNDHLIEFYANSLDITANDDKQININKGLGASGISIRGIDTLIYNTGDTVTDRRLFDTIFFSSNNYLYKSPAENILFNKVNNHNILELGLGIAVIDSNLLITPSDSAQNILGYIYLDEDDSILYYHNGNEFVDLTSGGGGDVSVSGTPSANQFAYWTDASTIGGSSNFTISSGDFVATNDIYADEFYINSTSTHLESVGLVLAPGGSYCNVALGSGDGFFEINPSTGGSANRNIYFRSGGGSTNNFEFNDPAISANTRMLSINKSGSYNADLLRLNDGSTGNGKLITGIINGSEIFKIDPLLIDHEAYKFGTSGYLDDSTHTIFMNHTDTLIKIDSINTTIYNYTHTHDSVYLDYLGVGADGAWLYLTPTNAIDTGTLVSSGFGLTMDIPETMTDFMKDQHNEELSYFYKNDGKIIKEYTIKGGPPKRAIQKIDSRIEITMRYVRELEKKNKKLEERIERLEKLFGLLTENKLSNIMYLDEDKIDEILEQSKQNTDEVLNLY